MLNDTSVSFNSHYFALLIDFFKWYHFLSFYLMDMNDVLAMHRFFMYFWSEMHIFPYKQPERLVRDATTQLAQTQVNNKEQRVCDVLSVQSMVVYISFDRSGFIFMFHHLENKPFRTGFYRQLLMFLLPRLSTVLSMCMLNMLISVICFSCPFFVFAL